MATFSTNQTRQLYVATANNNTVFNKDTQTGAALKHAYLTQTNATGEPVRSDLIDPKNVLWVKYTPAADMARDLKAVTVTLDATVNGGDPIVGQDYILRINFRQFASLGDQDTYVKHGAVRIFKGMDASKFYASMAVSLAKNFSRELTKLVEIRLGLEKATDAAGKVDTVVISANDKVDALIEDLKATGELAGNGGVANTFNSIIIAEVEQEWTLGIKPQEAVYFDVIPATVLEAGEEVTWGTVEEGVDGQVGNGKLIADLEYFCMGERGDVYRGIGWPNTIPTKYFVDATKTYDVIDIHYAYVGSNESVQKSEKTLTIVGEAANLATIKTAIQTALGVTL